MVYLGNGLLFQALKTLSALVFQLFFIFVYLTHLYEADLQMIGPPQPVIVMVGNDTVLPYHLKPHVDASQMTIEWGRRDLNPRFVYVWHNGKELLTDQNTAYKGRAALFTSRLKQGDVSLRLSKGKISDNGLYRCYIPEQSKEYFVELVVGSVSSPQISLAGLDKTTNEVVLQCESKGWYPEPEVLWLDGEGNVLSAGTTETVRGPDDLYTVSSRLTVDKSINITCRVQQNNINQSRDTYIDVKDDFFMAIPTCAASIAFSVLLGFTFILVLTVSVFVWKYTENKILEDLDKKKTKLDEDLQRTKEDQTYLEQTLITLRELMEELKKQKEKLTAEVDKPQKLAEEIHKNIKSVDEEVDKKEGDKMINKGHGYLKLKEIFKEFNWKLEEIKKEEQSENMINEKLMKPIGDEVNRITERKKEKEKHMEQIEQQLKETETQRKKILYGENMNQ